MDNKYLHIPVLLDEVLDLLDVKSGKRYIDCTLGAGGHSEAILSKGGKLLGIEADEKMLSIAKERLKKYCPTLLQGNFSDILKIATESGFTHVDGVLFDLGISSYHYETLNRGFSMNKPDELLDMRLEPNRRDVTAAMLLNVLPYERLIEMFAYVVNMSEARQLSSLIVKARQVKEFKTVSDLREVIHKSLPEAFLALRMAVNDEFHSIKDGLEGAVKLLNDGGMLLVISFHSDEDNLVLSLMKRFEEENLGMLVTKKPIVPGVVELEKNDRSRSALLRVFKKI